MYCIVHVPTVHPQITFVELTFPALNCIPQTQSRARPVVHHSKAKLVPIQPPTSDPADDSHTDTNRVLEVWHSSSYYMYQYSITDTCACACKMQLQVGLILNGIACSCVQV